MDDVFIAPRELMLGGAGIGITIVLLVILSLLQKSRLRREGEARLQALESEFESESDSLPGSTPFFVTCYTGGNARFFRVYSGRAELLFVNAGQYFALIDAESVRGTDQRHWLLRSVKLVGIGLAGGAVGAAIGVAAIFRAIARNAGKNPEAAGDITWIVFGIVGMFAMVVVVAVPLTLWQVTRRCRQLDPMSLARLRQEAELESKSFRATPVSVTEFRVALLDQRENLIPSQEIGSTISFKDTVTGRWKLETKATCDTRDALRALRSIWGKERVTVDAKLSDRLKE
jgi:F0F1-type ATP synthase membrane subunit c/vacuolar-type H+-ATPase subunit K